MILERMETQIEFETVDPTVYADKNVIEVALQYLKGLK